MRWGKIKEGRKGEITGRGESEKKEEERNGKKWNCGEAGTNEGR